MLHASKLNNLISEFAMLFAQAEATTTLRDWEASYIVQMSDARGGARVLDPKAFQTVHLFSVLKRKRLGNHISDSERKAALQMVEADAAAAEAEKENGVAGNGGRG
eukprot:4790733-Pleurochrysis_carterae.AAC.1